MSWNPLQKIKDVVSAVTDHKPPKAELAELQEAAKALSKGGEAPDIKELEKKGLVGKFFRHWKNPAFLKQMKAVAMRMQAEGVNVKDPKAIQAWIEKNKDAIESGSMDTAPAAVKQETVRIEQPPVGRNEPCACGSGKKSKKCCAK